MADRSKTARPWQPSPYSDNDVYCIKALAAGSATPEQQKQALDWIIRVAAGTYDQPYRSDSARDTDFALGRRAVGLDVVKLVNLPVALLKKERTR